MQPNDSLSESALYVMPHAFEEILRERQARNDEEDSQSSDEEEDQ